MKRICLISDTHSYMGADVLMHCKEADEIWHAGDIGAVNVLDTLRNTGKPVRAVYGNIDDKTIRAELPLDLLFTCEKLRVFITHIGSYPGRYTKRVRAILEKERPDLYICGHSHICKVMKDPHLGLLHMNPGACGQVGFHSIRTLLKFTCKDGQIQKLSVVELGRRGILHT